jgi:hypothetical protein
MSTKVSILIFAQMVLEVFNTPKVHKIIFRHHSLEDTRMSFQGAFWLLQLHTTLTTKSH